jgi:hypothetical protein
MIRCETFGASKRGKSTTNLHTNKEVPDFPALKIVMRLMINQESARPKSFHSLANCLFAAFIGASLVLFTIVLGNGHSSISCNNERGRTNKAPSLQSRSSFGSSLIQDKHLSSCASHSLFISLSIAE